MFNALAISTTPASTIAHSTIYEVVDFDSNESGYGLNTSFRGVVASYTWESGKPMFGTLKWENDAPLSVRKFVSEAWDLPFPLAV